MSKIKEELSNIISQENKTTVVYSNLDDCYVYICPFCGIEQTMTDLTDREERNLEQGEPIYYQCDTCETISEVTYED